MGDRKSWTVTGCRHYVVGSIKIGQILHIAKHPIENHPWNIAVFDSSANQVGTLTAARIKAVYEAFSNEGVDALVIGFIYDCYGQISQLKIRLLPS
jgi:hypothetical protein